MIGNRFGIGGKDNQRGYTSHKLKVEKGSKIFMFTDGYADQFGGNKDKKMMTHNFVKLLQSIQCLNVVKQGVLLKQCFDDWKGDLDQTDDMLIIGIEF